MTAPRVRPHTRTRTRPKRVAEPRSTADRRARILEAATAEFAARGYVASSTAAIAERAGVAKGLVFHHFGDKDALFLAAVSEIAKVTQPYFADAMAHAPRDLFGRVLLAIEKKIAFMRDEPLVSRFLIVGLADTPPALRRRALGLFDTSAGALWGHIVNDVDASSLREGVDVAHAVEAIQLLAAGIELRNNALTDTVAKARAFDVDAAVAHAKRMLHTLRDGLYRKR